MLLLAVLLILVPATGVLAEGELVVTSTQEAEPQATATPASAGELVVQSETAEPQPTASAQEEAYTAPVFDESIVSSATVAMVFDAQTGDVVYEKNPDQRVYPASTTKLLSAIIAIEDGIADRDVTVAVCKDDYSAENSLMGLVRGETISGKDLLYGMLLASGNDAAASVAVDVAGSMDAFAERMNEKARELGMTSSHFVNPHGLQNEEHYTTGNDMKKLAMYVFQNNLLMQIVGTKEYIVEPTDLCAEQRVIKNTNKLVNTVQSSNPDVQTVDYIYEYANGMKTGYTYAANGCLVASATKDDQSYIVLIFDDQSELGVNRWGMATELFNFAFDNYQKVYPSEFLAQYPVTETVQNVAKNDPDGGKIAFTPVMDEAVQTAGILVPKDAAEALKAGTLDVQTDVSFSQTLAAPIAKGTEVGTVNYLLGDQVIASASLVTDRQIYAEGQEDEQSEALGQSKLEFWSQPGLADGFADNKAVLWWLAIPIAVIAVLVVRAVMVSRRKKSRTARRMAAANARRYSYNTAARRRRTNSRYRGRY